MASVKHLGKTQINRSKKKVDITEVINVISIVNQCNKLDVIHLKSMKMSLTFCGSVCCCLFIFQYIKLDSKIFKKIMHSSRMRTARPLTVEGGREVLLSRGRCCCPREGGRCCCPGGGREVLLSRGGGREVLLSRGGREGGAVVQRGREGGAVVQGGEGGRCCCPEGGEGGRCCCLEGGREGGAVVQKREGGWGGGRCCPLSPPPPL